MTGQRLVLTSAALLALAQPAFAHHGWSDYDNATLTAVTGVVQEYQFGNPHGVITLLADGEELTATLAPPSRMERAGMGADSVAVGDTVTVEGHVNLSDPHEMKIKRVVVGDEAYQLY